MSNNSEEKSGSVTIYSPPLPDVQWAVEQYRLYREVCRAIIEPSDKVTIDGQEFWRRSAWAKLRRAFNISIEVVGEERFSLPNEIWGYKFLVRATLPDGRSETADGTCSSDEFHGRMKATEHNVRSKAATRATNRATANILGVGAVSAEEINVAEPPRTYRGPTAPPNSHPQTPSPLSPPHHWIDNDVVRKKFWGWTKTLGLSEAEVYAALGVRRIHDFDGTMADAKKAIEEWVRERNAPGSTIPSEE